MPGRIDSLSLQQKVSVTLLVVMGSMVLLSYLVLSATVAPAFAKLELATAEKNIVRAARAIQNDLQNLSAIVGDWAPWDDAHAYALGQNPGFPRSNLNETTMANLDIDLLLVYDRNGNVLWRHLLPPGEAAHGGHDESDADHDALRIFDRDNPKSGLLVSHSDLGARVEGLVQTGLGPMLLSSRPIITSEKTGPIVGTMIMGRFFDSATQNVLSERTEVELSWHSISDQFFPDALLKDRIISAGEGTFTFVQAEQEIQTFGVLKDLYGEPMMILQANTPRQISTLGSKAVSAALLFLLVAGLVVAAVTWFLLRGFIVMPLERLAAHISGIRESGDLTVRFDEARQDEIGALALEFDQMTLELHDARRQLLDQSFKAGKADTAAEVLHNIRNAMTPLINGIERLTRDFRFTSGLRIQQATGELGDPECLPERRSKLLRYIESAFSHVQKAGEQAVVDLQVASRQARQVEAILGDQERYANVAPVIEVLELHSIIEEAAFVIPDKNNARIQLNVQQGLDQVRVRGHRVGLVQVLGNLILNAYESVQRSRTKEGNIKVTAAYEEVDGQSMVRISVSDTGCGFSTEVKQNVFQRGFSSKEGHQRGLGLHWCANALANMGGRIVAESEGPELGAAFHVLLPSGPAIVRGTRARTKPGTPASTAQEAALSDAAEKRIPNEYATG